VSRVLGRPEPSILHSLVATYLRVRNRVLSDPKFQRWAAHFPPTRLVARHRANALFDLCAGFVYSQVLQAVVRLNVLEALAEPKTVATLAPQLALSFEATQRLLDAACSLRLVQRVGPSAYGVGIHGASLLGNPGVARMVRHHALLYQDLSDPVALLRGEGSSELRRFWSYSRAASQPTTDTEVAPYSELMADTLSMLAEDILDAYPLDGHGLLLDVGGGEGVFVEAAGTRSPGLALALFDLPPVAARARARLGRRGLLPRVTVTGGDVFRDPLPTGADIVSLVRVIHDHDDAEALEILRSVRATLPRGGVLLLAEPMAGTRQAEPMGDAYFGLYLLAMGQGRPRTEERLRALLLDAGFGRVRSRRTRRPMFVRVLTAMV